jgi:hypothetical protein
VVIFLALQEVCKLFRQALRLHMSSRLTNSEIPTGGLLKTPFPRGFARLQAVRDLIYTRMSVSPLSTLLSESPTFTPPRSCVGGDRGVPGGSNEDHSRGGYTPPQRPSAGRSDCGGYQGQARRRSRLLGQPKTWAVTGELRAGSDRGERGPSRGDSTPSRISETYRDVETYWVHPCAAYCTPLQGRSCK